MNQCQWDDDTSQETETEDEELAAADVHSLKKGEFFGCYLLVSMNPNFKGRTYIGFTVDPNRRIRQHNAGHHMGGARKTSGRGPWDMVLIVHGFPNEIAALRFEWAWQHPMKSRRLGKAASRKKSKETPFQYRFRILSEMLSVGPWRRLPLTVRWLQQEHETSFPLQRQPPVHMPITYGLVDVCRQRQEGCSGEKDAGREVLTCHWCSKPPESSCVLLQCYHKSCTMAAHITCLAPRLCEDGHILPVAGQCPSCSQELLWGELIRRYKAVAEREKGDSQPPPKRPRTQVSTKEQGGHWTELLHMQ